MLDAISLSVFRLSLFLYFFEHYLILLFLKLSIQSLTASVHMIFFFLTLFYLFPILKFSFHFIFIHCFFFAYYFLAIIFSPYLINIFLYLVYSLSSFINLGFLRSLLNVLLLNNFRIFLF